MGPSQQQIKTGVYKLVGGTWHRRCSGPAHEEPTYLPATDKFFYTRKTGARKGMMFSYCRLCSNWTKLKSPGSDHGRVPLSAARPFYVEAANRVGLMELANRTGIAYTNISMVIYGRRKFVRKANLRKVMLELVSMQRKGEHSINGYAAWRVQKRATNGMPTCGGCGCAQSEYTDGCSTCWERRSKRRRRNGEEA